MVEFNEWDKYYTIKEVSDMLKLPNHEIVKGIWDGRYKFIKLKGSWIIPKVVFDKTFKNNME